MKKRALFIMLTAVTLLFSGCGADGKGDSDEIEDLQRQLEELEAENEELRGEEESEEENGGLFGEEESEENGGLFGGSSTSVSSAINETTAETWGVCGADLTWYYQNGTLVIRGTGDMTDGADRPWDDLIGKIEWIIIEDGCTSIGSEAFYGFDYISKVELPESLISIGEKAFYECSSLTSINIPDGVTTIGEYAFYECSSLTSINIPGSVTEIGEHAFENCSNLTSINWRGNIYSSVAEFLQAGETGCECGADLTWDYQDGTLVIHGTGEMADYDNLDRPWYDFRGEIEQVIIEDGCITIGEEAFRYCRNLTSINIPGSVTTIGLWAFKDCENLTSINIPESVTQIGRGAFEDCDNLTAINYMGNNILSN